jgi:hypothetical protein
VLESGPLIGMAAHRARADDFRGNARRVGERQRANRLDAHLIEFRIYRKDVRRHLVGWERVNGLLQHLPLHGLLH